jgi:hypothetical protein
MDPLKQSHTRLADVGEAKQAREVNPAELDPPRYGYNLVTHIPMTNLEARC